MGYWVGSLYSDRPVRKDYKIAADLAEGVMVLRHTTTTNPGEIITSTTTAVQAAVGVTTEAATYTTTQATSMVEGVVGVIDDPFAIWRYLASGGATEGTAFVEGQNYVVNDTAETAGLVIADATIVTTNVEGGLIKGSVGANVGHTRVVTGWNTGTNVVVTVPFPNDIAASDEFVLVPWSKKVKNAQFTTALTEMNAAISTSTGGELTVHEVVIDEQNRRAWVDVIIRDHWLNAETA